MSILPFSIHVEKTKRAPVGKLQLTNDLYWWNSTHLIRYVSFTYVVFIPHLSSETREYCNMEVFNATCRPDEVIVMDSARYGRMKLGRCVRRNLGYLGCGMDVLPYMDKACTGKRQCDFTVPTPALYATQPCPGDTTPYLEAGHTCTKGKILFYIY